MGAGDVVQERGGASALDSEVPASATNSALPSRSAERGMTPAPGRGSPTLAAGWPRGMLARRRATPRAAAPDAALVARLLDAGEADMLLALLGEALLGGAEHAAIVAAARDIFLHRARHPLAPDPGLAALLAALSASDTP